MQLRRNERQRRRFPVHHDRHQVVRRVRDWVADAPDDLMTIVVHRKAPPLPFVPAELHGKPIVMVVVCWAGDTEEGEKFIKPLREFGNPVADVCMVKPYLTHQAMLDPSFSARPLVLLQELRRCGVERRDHRYHGRAVVADQVAADVVPDLADGRSHQERRRRRDALRRPAGRVYVQHRVLHGDRGGFRRGTGVGALLLVSPRALAPEGVRELPRERERGRVRTAYGAESTTA